MKVRTCCASVGGLPGAADLVPAPVQWAIKPVPSNMKNLGIIYAVDDVPLLTELYDNLLETAGYTVKTFNDRVQALSALHASAERPGLLITDYLGLTMPINQFIHACRHIQPSLRILMASGFTETEMRFSRIKPDRFIQKPFPPEELEQAVRAMLGPAPALPKQCPLP